MTLVVQLLASNKQTIGKKIKYGMILKAGIIDNTGHYKVQGYLN
jgi:hypothetical protein